MTLESMFLLAIAVLVFAFKPGPGILTSISYSLSHGVLGLSAFLLGFNVGLGIYLTVVFVGFMGVNHFDVDIVFFAILAKSFAALYLISIGVKGVMTWNNDSNISMDKIDSPKNFIDMMLSAIILTLSNPMVIVFYASIIPVFVAPELITTNLAFVIIAMLMFIDSMGMVVYCAPIIFFRKKLPEKFIKYMKLLSGIIVIFIGLYIGYTALVAEDILAVF